MKLETKPCISCLNFQEFHSPHFYFFFNLEHTQEVQSKLIKSGHLKNFIFKKNFFLHLNISGWFSCVELPILRPQVLPLASCPMWKLWVSWHLCCQVWLWLEKHQVLQDGLLWQLRAASQRPGIFWTTEGLKNVGRDKLLGSDLHNHQSDKSVCCCSTASYFASQVWYQIQLEKNKNKNRRAQVPAQITVVKLKELSPS